MGSAQMNSIVTIILSLIPFALVGGWLAYRDIKSTDSLLKKIGGSSKKIRVGDKSYVVKTKSRILAVEKKTGKEVIVTTCGFEDDQPKMDAQLQSLPEGIKVCHRLENGIFSPEESDWLEGENFKFLRVAQVEEYEQE